MNVEHKTKQNFSSLSAKLFEEFEEKEKEPNEQKMEKKEQGEKHREAEDKKKKENEKNQKKVFNKRTKEIKPGRKTGRGGGVVGDNGVGERTRGGRKGRLVGVV